MKRGRRDNGLDASAFVALRDVDPRVGEHLLDVLYAAGIAAYLEPTSDTDSYTRVVSLPSPPSDRLFVDRASRPAATSLVAEHADDELEPVVGGGPGHSIDEAWSRIIADYDLHSDSPVPPWPAEEDTDDEPRPDDRSRGRRAADREGADRDEADDDADEAGDVLEGRARSRRSHPSQVRRERSPDPVDPDDHYVPPPPPPVPRLEQATLGALVLIALGAMLLVAPGVLDLGADLSFVFGVLGIVAGVGLLVYRMREKLPDEDDPDDGAVV